MKDANRDITRRRFLQGTARGAGILAVSGSIASLKLAVMSRLSPTSVAPFIGVVKLTNGGVWSASFAVVKFHK